MAQSWHEIWTCRDENLGSFEEPDGAEPTPVSPHAAAKWATSGYGRMFRRRYGLELGWLQMHESGTFVRLTQAGADLFA